MKCGFPGLDPRAWGCDWSRGGAREAALGWSRGALLLKPRDCGPALRAGGGSSRGSSRPALFAADTVPGPGFAAVGAVGWRANVSSVMSFTSYSGKQTQNKSISKMSGGGRARGGMKEGEQQGARGFVQRGVPWAMGRRWAFQAGRQGRGRERDLAQRGAGEAGRRGRLS